MNKATRECIRKLAIELEKVITESPKIERVIKRIKKQGFDTMLVVEATLGLSEIEVDERIDYPTDELFLKDMRIVSTTDPEEIDPPK